MCSFFWNFFYPPHCINCSRIGTLFCHHCQDLIEPVELLSGIDHRITSTLTTYQAAYLFNTPIKEAITAFKYKGITGLAPILADLLYAAMPDWPITLCTAVPLHLSKQKSRGFNQAELLARSLAAHLDVPYQNLLTRTKQTRTQAHLTKDERLRHYTHQLFVCHTDLIADQSILLIDDVLTTGSTLAACAAALKQAGATNVYGLALAHGK